MRASHLIALLVMNAFWAASYSAFKALSPRLSAGEIVTWRFGLTAVLLALAWPLLPGRSLRGARDLTRAAFMGILVFAVGPRLQVLGVQLGKAGDSSVIVALEPIVTVIAAAFFLHEHVPARRWCGFALGMLGIALLNGAWRMELHGPALWANLVFLSSFICESIFSVMGKPLLARSSPFKVVAVSLFFGSAVNLLLDGPRTISRASVLGPPDWAWLAFLALICTLVGYTLWYVVIRDCDVNLAALTILLQPACGVLIAAWVLGETLHWGQLWGTLAILAGLMLGLIRFSPSPRREPAPPTPEAVPQ